MSNRLFSALDSANIVYAKRSSDRGVAYAGFRWKKGSAANELSVTAIIEQNVLRITVNSINARIEQLLITKSVAKLPMGKVYISPISETMEISLGLYIGTLKSLSPRVLLELLSYLNDTRDWVEGKRMTPIIPILSETPVRNGQDIIPILIGYGHTPTPIDNGATVELKLLQQLGCLVEIYERKDGWYFADAFYVPNVQIAFGQKELSVIQQLQHWATAGRFVLEDSGILHAEVLTPNLGQPPKDMISWTISQSTALLQVAARHLLLSKADPSKYA